MMVVIEDFAISVPSHQQVVHLNRVSLAPPAYAWCVAEQFPPQLKDPLRWKRRPVHRVYSGLPSSKYDALSFQTGSLEDQTQPKVKKTGFD